MTPLEQEHYASRPQAFWRSMESYYRDLQETVREDADYWQGRFLDLSCPPADVAGPLIEDVVHLADAGHDRVAEYLAALIVQDVAARGGLPPPLIRSGLEPFPVATRKRFADRQSE